MKASALAISMILILVPLAGCSGTDTEVNVDLSNEDINDLIDENLEDVMNNTTVVVFQEYHNNTTVINHNLYSNNTTNVDNSQTSDSTYNYNGTDGALSVFRMIWNWSDVIGGTENMSENNLWDVVDPVDAKLLALTTQLASVEQQLAAAKAVVPASSSKAYVSDAKPSAKKYQFDTRRTKYVGPHTVLDGVVYDW